MTDEKICSHTPSGDVICFTVPHDAVLGKLLCKKTPWRWTCTHCHILKDKRQGPAVQHRGLCSKPEWAWGLEENGYVYVLG